MLSTSHCMLRKVLLKPVVLASRNFSLMRAVFYLIKTVLYVSLNFEFSPIKDYGLVAYF